MFCMYAGVFGEGMQAVDMTDILWEAFQLPVGPVADAPVSSQRW